MEAAAARVAEYFARERGDAALADPAAATALLDAGFWASLRREEGFTPRISFAYAAPEHVDAPMRFERALPLEPRGLAKVGPAVERPGIHLGVWGGGEAGGELQVWGAVRELPSGCFVLEIVAPGLLVVKQRGRGGGSAKFINVAVLQGDQLKVIDQRAGAVQQCAALRGLQERFRVDDASSLLLPLAVSMRAHGRGGALLLTASGESEAWRESMLQPMAYAVQPAFAALGGGELRKGVEALAGLTAVDGATVIDADYRLLAFGAKIVRRRGWAQVDRVIVTEPIEGAEASIVEAAELGGTRHFSAAQFVHDQREALALVASQDGRFTAFGWSAGEEMVHAHRVETLLL